MTQIEFIDSLQDQWQNLSDNRLKNYNTKVRQFSDQERRQIFGYLLDNYTKQGTPQIADIVMAARELQIASAQKPIRRSVTHTWEPTDCPTCEGEGRVQEWISIWLKDGKRYNRLERRLPYSADSPEELLRESNYFSSISRCYCPAGQLPTLGNKWPRLKRPLGTPPELEQRKSQPGPETKLADLGDLDTVARDLQHQMRFPGGRQ